MNNKTIISIFENHIKELNDKDKVIESAYMFYEYELIFRNNNDKPDKSYFINLIEKAEPAIEEMYGQQDDDGSIASDIYKTAVLVAVSCLVSRVYDTIDPMTARECMHLGLYASRFLMKSMNDFSLFSVKEKLALLWAFAELSRTDVEIRNAYDHSLMAGMPQKMTRQKDYKTIVNELGRNIFTSQFFSDCLIGNENTPDLSVFCCLTILLDNGDYFEGIADAAAKCVFDLADDEISVNDESKTNVAELVILLAMLKTQYIIDCEESEQDSDSSQLIKVIEYNVVNKKDKLSEEEINKLKQRFQRYYSRLNLLTVSDINSYQK